MVTGASRGIGRGIALALAREGAFVGINFVRHRNKAENLLHSIQKSGGDGMLLHGDVSSADDCFRMVDEFAARTNNTIGILVCNAGIYRRGTIDGQSPEDWKKTQDVNVTGSYNMVRNCLPYLEKSKNGAIVLISSQLALKGIDHGTAYVTSKAALLGMTRGLALELSPRNIRVNAVAPGLVDTDILSDYSPQQKKERAREVPLGRLGTPEDIANAVLFLVSDMAAYVTGETLVVSGGSTIH